VADVVRSLRAGGRAEPGGVLAGRGAEQPAVLAVELGGAVVADEVADRGDITGAGDQERAGVLQAEHLRDNLAGLEVPLTPAHLHTLDEISVPVLSYPAPMHGALRAMLQFAGTTVDGEASAVYPPLAQSSVRY
jgi:hypothetical protein